MPRTPSSSCSTASTSEIDDLEGDVERLPGPEVRRRVAALRHELLVARRTASATRGVARRVLDGRIDVGHSSSSRRRSRRSSSTRTRRSSASTEELDVARDLLAGVRDYYQAKITEQQNDVAKKLTVIASLVLVPSLIVGFYGQNFEEVFDSGYWSLGTSLGLIVGVDARPARGLPLAPLDLSVTSSVGDRRPRGYPRRG